MPLRGSLDRAALIRASKWRSSLRERETSLRNDVHIGGSWAQSGDRASVRDVEHYAYTIPVNIKHRERE